MKRKNVIFYLISCILSLLLATSGLAQGLGVCGEKCCEKAQKVEPRKVEQGSLLNPKTFHTGGLDVKLSLCNLHDDILDKLGLPVPTEKPAEALPPCCHLEKAEKRVQGITNPTKSPRTHRLSFAGIHTILFDLHALNSYRNRAIADCAIHPRAAPVPLYLRNASFLC